MKADHVLPVGVALGVVLICGLVAMAVDVRQKEADPLAYARAEPAAAKPSDPSLATDVDPLRTNVANKVREAPDSPVSASGGNKLGLRVLAMTPHQAEVLTRDGRKLSIYPGDRLKIYGKVLGLDPEARVVVTENGRLEG